MNAARWSTPALIAVSALLFHCAEPDGPAAPPTEEVGKAKSKSKAEVDPAKVEEVQAFLKSADDQLRKVWVADMVAQWNNSTDITDEHEAAAASAQADLMATITRLVKESKGMADVAGLDADSRRQLHLLRLSTAMPAPDDEAKRQRLATIAAKLTGMYGKGKACNEDGKCRDLGELSAVLASSRDYEAQLDAWQAWRTVSPPMQPLYEEFVSLSNEGAEDLGFGDLGQMWRSSYDMEPEELVVEADRLWSQVQPLYEQLHCHMRAALHDEYGAKVPADGPIPAHLLGNMWAQSWDNLYPLVEPHPGEPSIDVTAALEANGYDEIKMVKMAEDFFTSLGLDPLPETFWERSMFTKPDDREVVCHASAWDVHYNDDLRIKMCIKVDHEDLVTLHHELGHNYYFHYYYTEPILYQNGAHDGFHEAVGDAIALSITPAHLAKVGLLEEVSRNEKGVLNKQMQDALAKIAFLPFGRMIDQWRWDVFSGAVAPADYNAHWWKLRSKYQGVAEPAGRPEGDWFDPGAKFHIPGNTPYMRYFLAHVLQFQFHEAMCRAAGHEGPLHTCSVYDSKEAGKRLQAMLSEGASQPWPETLDALAGTRQMDARPLVEYFGPLMAYLEEQNEGRQCGW